MSQQQLEAILYQAHINKLMSQIKSYLSIQSVGSDNQYQTPVKNMNHLTTNHSLAFSQTMGSLDNKKFNTQQTFYRSNQAKYQPADLNLHSDLREEQFENNNSCMTLSPVITQYDIQEMISSQKIIHFLACKNKDQKDFILTKQRQIQKLIEIRVQLQQKMKEKNNRFEKKQDKFIVKIQQYRQKQINNRQKAFSEIKQMKNEINIMKKRLSLMKNPPQNQNKMIENKRRRNPIEKKKVKIYVPFHGMSHLQDQIYYKNQQGPNQHQQRHFQPYPQTTRPQHYEQAVRRTYSRQYNEQQAYPTLHSQPSVPKISTQMSHQHIELQQRKSNARTDPLQNSQNTAMIHTRNSMNVDPPSKEKSLNILSILEQKLRGPVSSITMDQKNMKKFIQSQQSQPRSDQIKPAAYQQISGILQPNNSANFIPNTNNFNSVPVPYHNPAYNHHMNIDVKNVDKVTEEDLNYFDNYEQQQNNRKAKEDATILSRQKSSLLKSKSGQNNKSNPKITTAKWNNTQDAQDDFMMVSMLQHTQNKQKSQLNKTEELPLEKRYSDNIKLIQTAHQFHQVPANTPEHNNSIVELEYDDHNESGQFPNKRSFSKSSSQKLSTGQKRNQKSQFQQSQVNINVEELQLPNKSRRSSSNLSFQSSPSNGQNANKSLQHLQYSPTNKIKSQIPFLNIEKMKKESQMQKIEEVSSRIQGTNVGENKGFSNEKSVESRYTETQRDGPLAYSIETSKQDFYQSKGLHLSSQLVEVPLTKPPSLTELQGEEQDFLGSIRLNTDSRMSRDSKKKSPFEHYVQQFDDDQLLGDINLTAQSKISRDRNSSSLKNNEDFPEQGSHSIKMTQSETKDKDTQMKDEGAQESGLRESTRSSIVKKGSAIHKSVNRSQQSNKPANKLQKSTINMSRFSPELSNMPIEQVQEQQQMASGIQKKGHHRNKSNLQ